MTVTQSQFREAVLDPDRPEPAGLRGAVAGTAGARFDVYRNNVFISLTDALATAFPLVRKLLGAATFEKLASVFVRAHPPKSPLMMFYGDELPAFLAGFKPLAQIGYLADCARLDLAQRQAYHAADVNPFDAGVLQNPDADIDALVLDIAPATTILRSPWPLFDIWQYNMLADAPKPSPAQQDVLVTRPQFDPEIHLLPKGAADWLEQLRARAAFGQAYSKTLEKHPSFDLAEALSLAVTSGALAGQKPKENP